MSLLAYCKNSLKVRDRESWLLGQFLPRHLQSIFFPVKAFASELAHKPLLDEVIRSANHPIYKSLREIFHLDANNWQSSQMNLLREISHGKSTYKGNFSFQELEKYADQVYTNQHLLILSLEADSNSMVEAFSHLSKAHCLILSLKNIVPTLEAKINPQFEFPLECLERHGISQFQVIDAWKHGKIPQELQKKLQMATQEIVQKAKMHLSHLKAPKNMLYIELHKILLQCNIEKIEKYSFNPLERAIHQRPIPLLSWRLWKAKF